MMTCLFYGEGVCANNTMGKRRRFGRWLVAQYDHAVYIGPDSVHNSRPPSYRIISSQGGSQSWSKDRVRISSFKSSALTIKGDRKSTRLNSSHVAISYAVFCLKKKITNK